MPSPVQAASSAAIDSIRTIALVGPSGAGKTCLAEALLVASGTLTTAGTLERGTTVSDFDPLERRMLHSLSASVLHLQHRDTDLLHLLLVRADEHEHDLRVRAPDDRAPREQALAVERLAEREH